MKIRVSWVGQSTTYTQYPPQRPSVKSALRPGGKWNLHPFSRKKGGDFIFCLGGGRILPKAQRMWSRTLAQADNYWCWYFLTCGQCQWVRTALLHIWWYWQTPPPLPNHLTYSPTTINLWQSELLLGLKMCCSSFCGKTSVGILYFNRRANVQMCQRLWTTEWKYKTLPEAQRTQGIDSKTWVIYRAKKATCVSYKFGHQVATLVLPHCLWLPY